jgi:hypothetical protein
LQHRLRPVGLRVRVPQVKAEFWKADLRAVCSIL